MPKFEYRVEAREGYVFVWQGGRARTVDEVKRMTAEIDAAFAEVGARLAMFDNRETKRPDEWARAAMWTWLSENVSRAALLQAEVKNVKRAEERGERNRVVVRAFQDAEEAERWLVPKNEVDNV